MIVRISGEGQFELDDSSANHLNQLDQSLVSAVERDDEPEFHSVLRQTISFVHDNGREIGHDTVVPSDVIIPPEDITVAEAKQFFTDEGLLHPLPA